MQINMQVKVLTYVALAMVPCLVKGAYDPSTDPNFTGPITNVTGYVDRVGFCGNYGTPHNSCSFTAGINVCCHPRLYQGCGSKRANSEDRTREPTISIIFRSPRSKL